MEPTQSTTNNRKPSIDEALVDWLGAKRSGIDREAFIARHPHLASALRAHFANEDQVAGAFAGLQAHMPVAALASPRPPLPDIPGYELLEELGRGGMGVVYKARDKKLPRTVALKMFHPEKAPAPDELARFRAEVEAVAQLQHDHIVHVLEIGDYHGLPYFSMEYVEGESLADLIARAPMVPKQAAASVMVLADAMQYAHEQKIMHRDLKPRNVLVDKRGKLQIADFGLAKHLESEASTQPEQREDQLTQSGAILGTPSYMAPEQARGKNRQVNEAADIYSLGAVLYELLTGSPPFKGATPLDTLCLVCEQEPTPPSRLRKEVARDLETICLKCLLKEPTKRYATAGMLADDLRRFLRNEPILARPVSRVEKCLKWIRRRPAAAAAVIFLGLACLFGIGGGAAAWQWRRAEAARDDAESARQTAESAGQAAEDAKKKEETARRDLQEAHEQLQAAAFVGAAHHAWERESVIRARQLLEKCPERLRAWEWDFLKSICHPELLVLNGHRKNVTHVAYSPDGRKIASASDDLTVKVWDAASGKQLLSLEGHTAHIGGVAFSPDGRLLASASHDRTVRIWDAASGDTLKVLVGHTAEVSQVVFSPTEQRLASAGHDRTVRIWDTASGTALKVLTASEGEFSLVSCLVYSPDGLQLATGGFDRSVRTWDVNTGMQIWKISQPHQLARLSYSPDGKRLAMSTGDPTIWILDAHDGRKLQPLRGHNGPVPGLAFSPDGRYLASGGFDWKVKVWDTLDSTVRTLRGHSGKIVAVTFSPNGREIASASFDGTVRVWDSAGMEPALSLRADKQIVMAMAFSPDSSRILFGGGNGRVVVNDVADGKVIHEGKSELHDTPAQRDRAIITSVAYRPDGRQFASATQGGVIKLWDAGSGRQLVSINEGKASGIDRPVTIEVEHLTYSPNGGQLASAHQDQTVKVRDAESGKVTHVLRGHDGPVAAVAYSPDSGQLATASFDGTVKVWNAADGSSLMTLKGAGSLHGLAYSSDGRLLAAGGTGQRVDIWDARTGQLLRTLLGHTGDVRSLTFTPDGKRLATAGEDRTVRIWDPNSGAELLCLKEPMSSKLASMKVTFSPDGRRLAVALDGGELKIWLVGETNEERTRRRYARTITEVKSCERQGQWFAASFHLTQLLGQKPDHADFRVRLVHAQGMLHAERGEWREAAKEFAATIEARSQDALRRWFHGLALLGGNDHAGYRLACLQALKDFARAQNPQEAWTIIALAVVVPDEVSNAAKLVTLAEQHTGGRPDHAGYRCRYGTALYRAGRYQEALNHLEASVESLTQKVDTAEAQLFLAMTYHRLGKTAQAQKSLERATHAHADLERPLKELSGQSRSDTAEHPPGWDERLMLRLLHDEAAELLKGAK